MTIAEIVALLRDASPIVYFVGFGYLLLKDHIILGNYHRKMVTDRDNTILEQNQRIVRLEEDERKSRELAWMATDIGRYVLDRAKEEKVQHGT